MDYSPWGCKESDTTEPQSVRTRVRMHTHTHTHTHTPLFKGGVGRRGPEADEEKHPEKKRLARNSHG